MTRAFTTKTAEPSAATTQYLTFTLDAEEYAIDIARVQEIRAFTPITTIPTVPAYVKGVINLRGTVSPVVGLREKFGMASRAYDKFSVILVLVVGAKSVGVIVDSVADVMTVPTTAVEAVPELGPRLDTSFIVGMVRVGEKFAIVLDVDRIVGEPLELTAAELTPRAA